MIKFTMIILVMILCNIICCDAYPLKISDAFKQKLSGETTKASESGYTYTETSGGNFATQDGYMTIKRNIKPNYKDFYLKNKMNLIEVEIQGCQRSLNNVLVKEIIDSDLSDITDLHVFVEDPFDSTKRIITEARTKSIIDKNINTKNIIDSIKENYTVKNNIIYIKIYKLNPGENIKYNYKIHSNKSGIFDISTRLRLDDSRWPDLEKTEPIEIRPPEIQVYTECVKSYAIRDIPLNVTYCILHKDGWSKEPLYFDVKLNKSKEYTILYPNDTSYNDTNINLTIMPLEPTRLLMKVKYNEAGQYPFPGLDIYGATVYQDNTIIDVIPSPVIKWLQDNAVLFSILISLIAILITIFDFAIYRREKTAEKGISSNDYSTYSKLKTDLILEFYLFLLITILWIASSYTLSLPISAYISMPVILSFILLAQFISIRGYRIGQ